MGRGDMAHSRLARHHYGTAEEDGRSQDEPDRAGEAERNAAGLERIASGNDCLT